MAGLEELCKCNLHGIAHNVDFENLLKLADMLEQPRLRDYCNIHNLWS